MDPITRTSAIRDLGQMAFNMRFEAFCATFEIEDDSYARDKYTDLKALARALAPFTDSALARLSEAHAMTYAPHLAVRPVHT